MCILSAFIEVLIKILSSLLLVLVKERELQIKENLEKTPGLELNLCNEIIIIVISLKNLH